MKLNRLLLAVLAASNLIGLAACQTPTSESVSPSTPSVETKEMVLEDVTVTYDGSVHKVEVQNVPEGAKVSYVGPNKYKQPGTYQIKAKVTLADGTIQELTSTLVIEKIQSVLTAEEVQKVIHSGEGAVPSFTLDNTEQTVNVSKVYAPGSYTFILWAAESDHYLASNRVTVTLDVERANSLGIVFESEEHLYDGQAKELKAKNIPAGYTVEYENNVGTKQGKYMAVCKVKDAEGNLALTLNALLTIDNPINEEFQEYLDEFFVDYLGNDYVAWNIFTENSANFGLERETDDKAQWYYYESYGPNYKQEGYEEMQMYHGYLKEFENAEMSYDQKISYKVLDDFFKSNIEYYDPTKPYDPMVQLHYIDQFGGYAADFGTYMEAYSLRNVQDIEDVLSYIESLPESFATYTTYAQDRIDAGYPLSDYTIDEMIGYLDSVTVQEDNYYLTGVIQNNIKNVEFLSEAEKEEYCAKVQQYMKEYFMPAYSTLATDLVQYKGNCTQEGYWAAYGEVGKAEFVYELKDLLGMPELDMEAYGEYLKTKIETYSDKLNGCIDQINGLAASNYSSYEAFFDFYSDGVSIVGIEDPNKMIEYLKTFATTIVPTLESTPDINVKYMDTASARVSNAVAYYMKSALDSTDAENITLNGLKLSANYNDTLATMAHEGYPGHLYAYLYDKQLNISNVAKIMTSTAHAEGWATYVALKLYQYMKKNNAFTSEVEQKAINVYCDYMYYNDLTAYLAYTYVDYGIHYLGWSIEEVATYMDSIGFNGNAAQEMYRTLIESPVTYAAYGYGMSFYVDLHNNAQMKLGKYYNEVEFNSVILSHGWCSLSELQRITDEYIEEMLHVCTVVEG